MEPITTKQITYEDYHYLSGTSELNSIEAADLFSKMDWREGAFLYFDVNGVNLLQIMYLAQDKFLIEITNDSEDMVFQQKYGPATAALEMVLHFYETQDIHTVSGFYEVPINEKTLDQVMKAQ
jgi:hypothetical protein